jgi:hypothetical protein
MSKVGCSGPRCNGYPAVVPFLELVSGIFSTSDSSRLSVSFVRTGCTTEGDVALEVGERLYETHPISSHLKERNSFTYVLLLLSSSLFVGRFQIFILSCFQK